MAPSSSVATLTLMVEKGPWKGHTVECIPGRRVRIGRVVKGNTLTIKDAGISQSHLSIVSGSGTWTLTDLGSSNGTLLNGTRVVPLAPATLRDGDTIKIGEETAILVRIATEEAAAAPVTGAPRRNPRRGRAVATEVEPTPPAAGAAASDGARRTARSRRTANAQRVSAVPGLDGADPDADDVDGCDGVGDEGKTDLIAEEIVKGQRKKVSASRRGRPKKAAAAPPRVLDSVSEEFENEEVEVNGDLNTLKEVKQEIPDPVQIQSVQEVKASVAKGKGAARSDAEQVRVEEKRDAPAREEADVGGAVPSVEGGVDMENMTLEEWFDRMEKYLPKVINEIAEEVISEIKAQAEKFKEHIGDSLDFEGREMEEGFLGPM